MLLLVQVQLLPDKSWIMRWLLGTRQNRLVGCANVGKSLPTVFSAFLAGKIISVWKEV
jgi:hypothetical protein